MKFSLLMAFGLAFIMTSCEQAQIPPLKKDSEINKWILTQMQTNYYWQAEMPTKPNMTASPVDLFNSLKNPNDKYSAIQDKNQITSEAGVELGFEYAINKYLIDNKTYYVILYVKPGTGAEGDPKEPILARGNIIARVNGIEVTEKNAATLLVTEAKKGSSVNLDLLRLDLSTARVTINTMPAASYKEDPVLFSGIYTNKNAEKAAYLVYNIFRSDNKDGSHIYNRGLMNKLNTFAADPAIKYLILDLRYNAGGDLNTATYLASAIVEARKVEDSFIVYQRNPVLGPEYKKFADKIDNTDINIPAFGNQLKKVYILTGKYTAAASETFIHCLRAYLGAKVEVIGVNTTAGVNYLTKSYSQTNNTSNPYILKLFYGYVANKNNDSNYGGGIKVDVVHDEIINSTHQLRLEPLGSLSETLFKVALDRINGVRSSKNFNEGAMSTILGSSIESKPWANQNIDEDINF